MFGSFISQGGAGRGQLQFSFLAQAANSISAGASPVMNAARPLSPAFPLLHRLAALFAQVIHRFMHRILRPAPCGMRSSLIPACRPPLRRVEAGWTGPARRKLAALGGAGASAHVEQAAPSSMGRSSFWKLASGSGPNRVRLSLLDPVTRADVLAR